MSSSLGNSEFASRVDTPSLIFHHIRSGKPACDLWVESVAVRHENEANNEHHSYLAEGCIERRNEDPAQNSYISLIPTACGPRGHHKLPSSFRGRLRLSLLVPGGQTFRRDMWS
jgi:hypothetical protein